MRVAVFLLLGAALASVTTLWPIPRDISIGGQEISLNNLTWVQSGFQSDIIAEATARYSRWIFPLQTDAPLLKASVDRVEIYVQSSDQTLQLGIDESYSISISASSSTIKINAQTIYGALHGIETLSQCIDYDAARKMYITQSVTINDKPRFPWRGLLVDTSRHYMPMDFIKTHIVESLVFNKMNTLHLHIVDAVSWPLVVPEYPLLSARGAYAPEATYTMQQIGDLVEYARRRGVRVVPEIDLPGHSYAIGQGYPDLVAHCPSYEKNVNNIPVNPTRNETYEMLRAVLGGLARVCPDVAFHTGGDEVVSRCWQEDASIMQWCKEHGIATMSELYAYFEQRLQPIVHGELHRDMVVWEEAWLEKAVRLDSSVIVEAWRSVDVLHQIVAAGYRGILAAPWYLDKQNPDRTGKSTHYEFMDTWRDFYAADPETGNTAHPVPAPANAGSILGGEACMWAEQVDEASFDDRVWPRAGAVAERLWSPATVIDPLAAVPRLNQQSCRMKRRGIASGPIAPGSYCPVYGRK